MLNEITDPLIRSQIRDAFIQYHQGRIQKDYCLANIKMLLDFAVTNEMISVGHLDAQRVFDDLKEKEDITIIDVITKNKPQKWVENFDARFTDMSTTNSLFQQYQRVLSKEGKTELAFKLKKEVYQILDCTPKPMNEIGWRYKGLVFGKVQSGKTSNFIGLIAKSIDVGYDFIIVLAGISEDLRQQTQDRIDKYIFRHELDGIKYKQFKQDYEASENSNLINLTVSSRFVNEKRQSGDFRLGEINRGTSKGGPEILIIKKNSSVLKDVLRYLDSLCDEGKGFEKKINSKTCLIIDDECDNASVLSQSKLEFENDEETKAINLGIRRMINLFKRITYVGYTATPENVVMQQLTSPEKLESVKYRDTEIDFKIDKNLTLFPDDFIQIVEPSEGYLGLSEFLNSTNDYIRTIPSVDLPETKHDPYFLSDSIISSFLDFLTNIYIRKHLWNEHDNNSMLLHPSALKTDQEDLKELLSEFRRKLLQESLEGKSRSTYFGKVEKRIQDLGFTNEIDYQHYIQIIENLEIITVHSGKTATTLNFKITKDRVIVGGNKLARGFTVEGLTVSYFFRKSSRLDTLHQMARWFGYRGKSQKLIKVYLPEEDKEYFEFMKSFDEDLVEQIDSMNFQELDPASFGLSLIYNPAYLGYNKMTKRRMDLTDKNKMRQFEVDARFTRPIMSRSLLNNKDSNKKNHIKAFAWFKDLVANEEPFTLKFSTKKNEVFYERSDDITKGGKIYFKDVPLKKILNLYDSLDYDDSSTIASKFIESIRGKMDVDFNKWSVMISRKVDDKDFNEPFFINRTYKLVDDHVYVSSVEDPSNLQEDIFDLIDNEKAFKIFLAETPAKRTVELNKRRQQLKKPLLKVYFTQPSNNSKGVQVAEAVLIGFKFPAKRSIYVRKQ